MRDSFPSVTVEYDQHVVEDGRVLVWGGPTNAAYLYDPMANTLTATGSMQHYRYHHGIVLLPNGKVLVACGQDISVGGSRDTAINSAEIYDPATGTWTFTGNMSIGRGSHTFTLLNDGRVLATGGYARLYLHNNNAPGIQGDGQTIAFALGVPLKDMEFVQFYPTAVCFPKLPGLSPTTPAFLRIRVGARLYNALGEEFMAKKMPGWRFQARRIRPLKPAFGPASLRA